MAEGVAEASKAELGTCAVLKSRIPIPPIPQRRHTIPKESAARDGRLACGIVRYNGKSAASAKCVACHVETSSETNALDRATL